MPVSDTTVFPYRHKTSMLLLATLFFAVGTQLMAYKAETNDRGLILNGLLHLSSENAARFYWVIAGLAAALTVAGLTAVLMTSRVGARNVRLTRDRLIAPQSPLGRRIVEVPYASITGLAIVTVSRQVFLEVRHSGGKLTILRSAMQSPQAFDDLARALAARTTSRPV